MYKTKTVALLSGTWSGKGCSACFTDPRRLCPIPMLVLWQQGRVSTHCTVLTSCAAMHLFPCHGDGPCQLYLRQLYSWRKSQWTHEGRSGLRRIQWTLLPCWNYSFYRPDPPFFPPCHLPVLSTLAQPHPQHPPAPYAVLSVVADFPVHRCTDLAAHQAALSSVLCL